MTDALAIDLIKAVFSLTNQLELISRNLEGIVNELSCISANVDDAGQRIANEMEAQL